MRTRLRILAAIVLAIVAIAAYVRLGPVPADLVGDTRATSTVVVDRHGVQLYEALSAEGTRSVHLTAASIPDALAAATVAAEDHRFWSHPGIDPLSIGRALVRNVKEGRVVEGGSTISQQVAKLLLARRDPTRRRTVRAKIAEATLALRLEHRSSKREMLAQYLNLASYGNQIVGAERASQAYFGRPASMLTTAQAAFLAGLPQRPSAFNPFRSTTLAISRQRVILRRMQRAGYINEAQLAEALGERLSLNGAAQPAFTAPHFVEMVLAHTRDAKPSRIETTIDAALQADVAGIIASHRPMLDRHGAANVAVVVLDNRRGEWLAWEGSGDYFNSARGGSINGAIVPRQPGSALKPFTYALAFEQGYSPASVLPDIPSSFPTAEPGVVYSPRNYDGIYRGPMLIRRALAGSENVPAVALASELGVPALLRFLNGFGLTTFDKNAAYYGVGLTLGNAEVRLDELVAAYATFARGGERIEPAYLRRRDAPKSERVISARTAFWITDVLSDNQAREYIFGRGGSLEFPFEVAVKTGTSQAYHDNWTVGYTRDITVGVWVGNFDRRPLRNSSGVTGAAPIFHAVMLAAQKHAADGAARIVPQVPDVEQREICAMSGAAANAWCPARQREWIPANQPESACAWHVRTADGVITVWPAEYRTWARDAGLLTPALRLSDAVPARLTKIATSGLRIASPAAGSTYLIDPTLRREFQELSLRVTTDRAGAIEWSVNGAPLGSAHSDAALSWPLAVGVHTITARDPFGRTSDIVITVR